MVKDVENPLERLFGSKTRTKLLQLFFGNPDKSFYVREITRVIEEQINSVRRELLNLDGVGIIKNETFDNKVYYSANMKHPYSHALTELFNAKASNVSRDSSVRRNSWDEMVQPVRKYLTAVLATNRQVGQDGIDLLIVGNDRTKKLTRWAEVIEKKQGKPLNYVIMSDEDFAYRRSVRDRFLADVLEMEVSDVYDPQRILK